MFIRGTQSPLSPSEVPTNLRVFMDYNSGDIHLESPDIFDEGGSYSDIYDHWEQKEIELKNILTT